MANVIVIGGGFAGLNLVKALCRSNHAITLIDRTNHHLFQPLLYQVATAVLSPADIAVPIREVFRNYKNVRVLMGDVIAIDKQAKSVTLSSEKIYHYDYLIIATGSRHSYFGKNEWEPYAQGLKTVNDALQIRQRILMAFEKAEREDDIQKRQRHLNFVIVGGGPTGVEMAGSIADIAYHNLVKDFRQFSTKDARIYLIEACDRVLPMFSQKLSEDARRYLSDFGVIVRTHERVTAITDGVVETENDRIESDNIIWAAGNEASPLLQCLDVPLDRQGRVQVESHCNIPGSSSVFVIGDAAHFSVNGNPLPGIAPVAIQQGKYLGRYLKNPHKKKPAFCVF